MAHIGGSHTCSTSKKNSQNRWALSYFPPCAEERLGFIAPFPCVFGASKAPPKPHLLSSSSYISPTHIYIYITPSRSSSSSGNPSSWPWKVRKALMAASIAFNPTATIAPVSSAKKKIAPLRFYSPVSATSRSLLIRSSPFPKSRSESSSAFPGKKRS